MYWLWDLYNLDTSIIPTSDTFLNLYNETDSDFSAYYSNKIGNIYLEKENYLTTNSDNTYSILSFSDDYSWQYEETIFYTWSLITSINYEKQPNYSWIMSFEDNWEFKNMKIMSEWITIENDNYYFNSISPNLFYNIPQSYNIVDKTAWKFSPLVYIKNSSWNTDFYYVKNSELFVNTTSILFEPVLWWWDTWTWTYSWTWATFLFESWINDDNLSLWEDTCVWPDYEWYFWGFYKFGCYAKNFFNNVINGFKWVYNWFLKFINAFSNFTDVEHKDFTSFFFNSAYADNSESQIINIMTSWSFESNPLLNNIFNFVKWFLVFTAFLSVYFMFFNPNNNK